MAYKIIIVDENGKETIYEGFDIIHNVNKITDLGGAVRLEFLNISGRKIVETT